MPAVRGFEPKSPTRSNQMCLALAKIEGKRPFFYGLHRDPSCRTCGQGNHGANKVPDAGRVFAFMIERLFTNCVALNPGWRVAPLLLRTPIGHRAMSEKCQARTLEIAEALSVWCQKWLACVRARCRRRTQRGASYRNRAGRLGKWRRKWMKYFSRRLDDPSARI